MKQYETSHLVKGEDLNHHGTLFAARAAGWLVEAAFVAAGCTCGTSEGIVCRNLHHMSFRKPVHKGAIVRFAARIVYVGKSSFTVMVTGADAMDGECRMEGMITFVTIDGAGGKRAHGICLDAAADEYERQQRERASAEMEALRSTGGK